MNYANNEPGDRPSTGSGQRLRETMNGQTTTFTMDLNPSTSLRAGMGLT